MGRKARAFLYRPRLKQEIDEELQFHLERRTAENIAAGMQPMDAAREARRRFGNFQNSREDCRRVVGANFGESVAQDIRFGLRSLCKNPGFAAISILTLALGVGATTAIYSVVNAVILNPIPGPNSDRVVQIAERNYTQGLFKDQNNQLSLYGVCPEVLEALLPHTNLFANFAWCDTIWLDRKTEDFTETVSCVTVPANFFGLWNVPPLRGRTFAPDEGVPLDDNKIPERDAVLVLSYTMWQSDFAGDRNILGRVIELSGRHFTVVGVMPDWFAPEGAYNVCWMAAEPWHVPANQVGELANTRVCARLAPGASLAQAQAMVDTVAAQLRAAHRDDFLGKEWKRRPEGLRITVRPLRAQFQGSSGSEDLRRTLFGLLGAISFVLLIVCANIANLTLARTEKRQQELAIRGSIGAGRWRLTRQLLTESILLACAGGLAGIAVSVLGMKVLLSVVPASMPRVRPVQLDGHALAYTLLISIAAGILFGVMPAWRAGRAALSDALKQAGLGATAGARRSRYRGALIVAETALAVVLLAGAGLMIKSVVRLLQVNPGFDPENLLCVNLQLPFQKYSDYSSSSGARHAAQLRKLLFSQLQERIQALPGVTAVGIGKHNSWPGKVTVEGTSRQIEVVREGSGVGPSDLFRAMRAPLLAGRLLEERDRGATAGTAVINETMARTVWPGVTPLGKKFETQNEAGGGITESYEVIGIVGNLRDASYTEQIRPAFYRPCDEFDVIGRPTFLVIRTKTDPRLLMAAIRKELKAAEPDMTSPGISTAQAQLYQSTQAQRTYMEYLVVFASVGVLLCAIGIYGVLAYSVARRVREIGIRVAVGAQRTDVLRMVIGEGLRLVLLGLAAGLAAAVCLTKFLQSQLFKVTPTDPWVMASVVGLLLVVALLACYLPGRRAANIDPMSALRYE